MDLGITVIPALIGFLGYTLTKDGKNPRTNENIRKSTSPYEQSGYTNTYHSVHAKKIAQDQQTIGNIRTELAKNPAKTNIIPQGFTSTQAGGYPIISNTVVTENQKTFDEMENSPMFKLPKMNDQSTLGNLQSTVLNDMKTKEGFQVSELSGLPMDFNVTTVPHFGSSVKQNITDDKNRTILDLYTGSYNVPKKEVANMFEPTKENIYGTTFDADRTRYTPSNLKTSQLPQKQVKVEPLPVDLVRPMYRTTEERNIVNPRRSYQSAEPRNGISASNVQRGLIGKVQKNKPETSWGWGLDRAFTGSAVKKSTERENFKNKRQGLAENRLNIAPAKASVTNGLVGLVRENATGYKGLASIQRNDHRNTDHTFGIRNAAIPDSKNSNVRDSYFANDTLRGNEEQMFITPAGNSGLGEHLVPSDKPKVTNKQINLFSYTGSAKSGVDANRDYSSDYNYTKKHIKTMVKDYTSNPSFASSGYTNTDKYENVEINSNREGVSDLRNYILKIKEGPKISGSNGINVLLKDDTTGTSKFDIVSAGQRNIINEINNGSTQGLFDTKVSRELTETEFKIDPSLLSSLNDNPYNIDITK